MAEVKADQEPSIEEILESIRQIISEDGEEEAKPAEAVVVDLVPAEAPPPPPSDLSLSPTAAAPEPPPVPLSLTPEKPVADKPFDEPLDLTEKIVPAGPALSLTPAPAPVPPPSKIVSAPPPPEPITIDMMDTPMTDNDKASTLISTETANTVTDQLSKLLSTNIPVESERPAALGKVTFEDMVRDLMKPLVKTWLDQNLPGIIEKVVQKEVEKLSRRAADR